MEAPNAKSHLFSSGALSHKAAASPVLSLCLVTHLIWSCACNSARSSKTKQKNPHEVYVIVFCCIYHFNSKVWPVHDLCMLWTKACKPGKCCWKKHCLIASKYCVFWPRCVDLRFLYSLCGISTPLRPSLHPINMLLSLCSVIMNPSVWKVTSAVGPRTVPTAGLYEWTSGGLQCKELWDVLMVLITEA